MDLTSDVEMLTPERAPLLQNILSDQKGMLRTSISFRNLLTSAMAAPVDAVGYYYAQSASEQAGVPNPQDRIMLVSAGNLYAMPVAAGTPVPGPGTPVLVTNGLPGTTPPLPFTPGQNVHFVEFDGELILLQADGLKPPYRYDGTTIYLLGITAPTEVPVVTQVAPPGGVGNKQVYTLNLANSYRYRYAFHDSRGRESSLGAASLAIQYAAATLPDTGSLAGSIAAPSYAGVDPQVTGASLYEQVPGNVAYYRVARWERPAPAVGVPPAANNPFIDNMTDDDVTSSSSWPYSDNLSANDPPKPASVGAVHKNYLWLNNTASPETLQVSNQGSATQFSQFAVSPALGGPFLIETDWGDPVMMLHTFGSVLGVWKQRTFHIVFGDTTLDFIPRAVHDRGTLAPETVVRCDNQLMSHGLDGVYSYDFQSVFLQHLMSQEIDAVFDGLVKTSTGAATIETALSAYIDNKYVYFLSNNVYIYDFRADPPGWYVWHDVQGMRTEVPGQTRCVRSVFSVSPRGRTPYLICARTEGNQIAVLDLFTDVAQSHVIWESIPIDGTPDHPEMRHLVKRYKRVRIYGEGTLDTTDAGVVSFATDNGSIVQSYQAHDYLGLPQRGILLEMTPGPNLVGRNVAVTLDLNGTGLVIRHIQTEWVNLL